MAGSDFERLVGCLSWLALAAVALSGAWSAIALARGHTETRDRRAFIWLRNGFVTLTLALAAAVISSRLETGWSWSWDPRDSRLAVLWGFGALALGDRIRGGPARRFAASAAALGAAAVALLASWWFALGGWAGLLAGKG